MGAASPSATIILVAVFLVIKTVLEADCSFCSGWGETAATIARDAGDGCKKKKKKEQQQIKLLETNQPTVAVTLKFRQADCDINEKCSIVSTTTCSTTTTVLSYGANVVGEEERPRVAIDHYGSETSDAISTPGESALAAGQSPLSTSVVASGAIYRDPGCNKTISVGNLSNCGGGDGSSGSSSTLSRLDAIKTCRVKNVFHWDGEDYLSSHFQLMTGEAKQLLQLYDVFNKLVANIKRWFVNYFKSAPIAKQFDS